MGGGGNRGRGREAGQGTVDQPNMGTVGPGVRARVCGAPTPCDWEVTLHQHMGYLEKNVECLGQRRQHRRAPRTARCMTSTPTPRVRIPSANLVHVVLHDVVVAVSGDDVVVLGDAEGAPQRQQVTEPSQPIRRHPAAQGVQLAGRPKHSRAPCGQGRGRGRGRGRGESQRGWGCTPDARWTGRGATYTQLPHRVGTA